MTDQQLLARYADHHDQQAFAELVGRHVDWINSMALRLVHDPALAADVTQAVFAVLARKASSLRHQQVLFPWLFSVTRFAGCKTFRDETRRRKHERKAAAMREETAEALKEPSWEELSPLLDELVDRLRTSDRQVVLLRFYGQKSFAEIGKAMKISEVAARKRVARAVDQLRDLFARRGVTIGATVLTTSITANLTQPASAAVLASATAASASGASTALVNAANAMLTWTSLKPVAAIIAFVLTCSAVATVAVLQTAPAQQAAAAPPSTMPATAPAVSSSMRYGRVLTQDDKPVAGARVWQTSYSQQTMRYHTVATVTTNTDGRFQLPITGEITRVVVQAEGFAWSGGDIQNTIQDDPDEIRVLPSTTMRVRFVDSDGKPVPGVRIKLKEAIAPIPREGAVFPEDFENPGITQITDSDGACSFTTLARGGRASLEVADERFAQLGYGDEINLSDSDTTDGGVIHLKVAASISGKVVYGDSGKAAEGIWIYARVGGSNSYGWARTDAHGHYDLKQLSAGRYIVMLHLSDEMSQQYTAVALNPVPALPGMHMDNQDLTLISGGIVRIKFTEQGSGKPLKGMKALVQGPSNPKAAYMSQTATSDADGVYAMHVPAGEQQIEAYAPPLGYLSPRPSSFNITVADNQSVDVKIEYPRSRATPLTGRAVDPDGRPLAGVRILVQPKYTVPPGEQATVTDASGVFTLPLVDPGSTLRARKGNWSTLQPVAVTGENPTVVLHENSQASIRVTVRQPDGTPLAGATVQVTDSAGNANARCPQTSTASDGTCILTRLDPDMAYRITVSAKKFGSKEASISIQPGQLIDAPPIVLRKADSFVAGMVVDETGNPVSDIMVTLRNGGVAIRGARTDITGRFRIDGIVPEGRLSIAAEDDDHAYRGSIQNVVAGTADLVITIHSSQPAPTTRPAN